MSKSIALSLSEPTPTSIVARTLGVYLHKCRVSKASKWVDDVMHTPRYEFTAYRIGTRNGGHWVECETLSMMEVYGGW